MIEQLFAEELFRLLIVYVLGIGTLLVGVVTGALLKR